MTAHLLAVGAAALLAPVAGALWAGADRRLVARLQGRAGPPLLQPVLDVRKLLAGRTRWAGAGPWLVAFPALALAGGLVAAGDLGAAAAALAVAGVLEAAARPARPGGTPWLHRLGPAPVLALAAAALAVSGPAAGARAWPALALLTVALPALRRAALDRAVAGAAHGPWAPAPAAAEGGPSLALREAARWAEASLLAGLLHRCAPERPLLALAAGAAAWLLHALAECTTAPAPASRALRAARAALLLLCGGQALALGLLHAGGR